MRLETAESELWGWWDADRLTRLVDNLVDNAIKYSRPGRPVTVRLAQHDAGAGLWAVLEVEDSGVGIPAAELPHIFEPFHRAHNVTGTVAGNGLGLWGCRAIVEQHSGTLSVASREGEGTTFMVGLPLRR
jgi:signal transduction histidine kinase